MPGAAPHPDAARRRRDRRAVRRRRSPGSPRASPPSIPTSSRSRPACSCPGSSTTTPASACSRRTWAGATSRSAPGVEDALGLPVSFSHDVRGAGEAEHRLGAAAPFRDVVVMAIGTGIAGAIFSTAASTPAAAWPGEIGHSRVADGPACACGGRGCLEAVASAGAIARRYTARTGVDGRRARRGARPRRSRRRRRA